MGSDEFYPEEKPVREVGVDGFWIDPHAVTVAEFARFATATGYVTVAEREPDRADYPDADPALLVAGSLVFRRTSGPVDLDDERAWWEYVRGRGLASPRGARLRRARARPPPGHARRLRGRAGLRRLGRPRAPHRGRVGVRRARRARGRPLRLGRRRVPGRARRGQHLAGRVPVAEPAHRRLRGHVALGRVRAQRLRALRHDRQRVGVDERSVSLHRGRRVPAPRRPRAARTCPPRTTTSATGRRPGGA